MEDLSDNEIVNWNLFRKFIKEFENESDRAAVILIVAKIDLLLYQILQHYFIDIPASKDELLDGDSPLGTLSAKINISYRLGLIDATFTKALHLIRKIRNDFAHEVSGSSLQSSPHQDRVKELTKPFQSLEFYKFFKETFLQNENNASINFRTVTSIIISSLEAELNSIQTIESTPRPLILKGMKEFKKPEMEINKLNQ
jgi:DNA-binding MltR family transcriptional regulator